MKKYFKTIFLALFLISLFLIPAFSADNPDNAVLNDPTIDNTAIEDQSKTTANLNKSDESASSVSEQFQF